jgi:hypothetical protein
MVGPVDENDFDRRFPKSLGRSQTTKSAADDYDAWRFRRLRIRTIERIEIGIVHPSFLKLPRPEISENLGFLADPDGPVSGERTAALSSEPETDKKNQNKRGDAKPRDEKQLDSDVARGREVVVDVRVAVKESVTIAKDVCASSQVDEKEEGRRDS